MFNREATGNLKRFCFWGTQRERFSASRITRNLDVLIFRYILLLIQALAKICSVDQPPRRFCMALSNISQSAPAEK